MKRKQTRFTTEEEIIKRIDDVKDKRLKLIKRCEEGVDIETEEKINKQVRRIEDSTLPRLKNALAAFRTEVMAFVGDDKGVVL